MKREQVLPHVMADMAARIAKGADEYGEPLTTFNGRDALQDSYEEALDLAVYLKQALMERKTLTEQLMDGVSRAPHYAYEPMGEVVCERVTVAEACADWPGPDWAQAPEWAVAWAVDPDVSKTTGQKAHWYFKNPVAVNTEDSCYWSLISYDIRRHEAFQQAPLFGYPGDWRDSLRKRPK